MRTNKDDGLPLTGFFELKQDVYDTAHRLNAPGPARSRQLDFCTKYIPFLRMIEDDPELKEACAAYSAYEVPKKHNSLFDFIYDSLMKDAYASGVVVTDYMELLESAGIKGYVGDVPDEKFQSLSAEQILGCIAWHFRCDHFNNGSLVSFSVGSGQLLMLLETYADKV